METQNIAQNWRGTQIRLIKDFLNERRFVRVPAGTIGIILSKAPERDTLNYIVISIRFAGKHYPCHNVPSGAIR